MFKFFSFIVKSIILLVIPQTVHTAEECGVPLLTYRGVTAYANGDQTNSGNSCATRGIYGLRYQCVEYVKRFYAEALGMHVDEWHADARDFYAKAAEFGLEAFPNNGTVSPQPDDIIVFNKTNTYGHVAIVTAVDAHSVNIIEQNWGDDATGELPITISNGRYNLIRGGGSLYHVVGWLRPTSSRITGKFAFVTFDRFDVFNGEIFSINADGSERQNLTNHPNFDSHPSWSPDGTQIAFSSDRNGIHDIFIMNADGSRQQNLTNFQDFEGDYELVFERSSWSPDGSQIVFENRHEGNPEIFIINTDGSGRRNLSNNASYDGYPSWSPDGTQITFVSDRIASSNVWVMNTDGTNQRRLTNYLRVSSPAWSPDGTLIAFVVESLNGNSEIYIMNANGSDQRNLTNHPSRDINPSWSADGKSIAFESRRDGNAEIYVMNLDGSGLQNITNSAVPETLPDWCSLCQ